MIFFTWIQEGKDELQKIKIKASDLKESNPAQMNVIQSFGFLLVKLYAGLNEKQAKQGLIQINSYQEDDSQPEITQPQYQRVMGNIVYIQHCLLSSIASRKLLLHKIKQTNNWQLYCQADIIMAQCIQKIHNLLYKNGAMQRDIDEQNDKYVYTLTDNGRQQLNEAKLRSKQQFENLLYTIQQMRNINS